MIRTGLNRLWRAFHTQTSVGHGFAVACRCGAMVTGQRQRRYQSVPCPACGRPVFVLGKSPLPPTGLAPESAEPGRPAAPRWRRPWLAPVLGGVGTLAAVLVAFWVCW